MLLCGVCVCVLSLALAGCTGFNLAARNATVIGDPLKQNASYFGFTVNIQRQEGIDGTADYWLIVGAPKANSSSQASVTETGAAYRCDLTDFSCNRISLDNTADVDGESCFADLKYKHLHRRAWVGGSVAVSDYPGEKLLVGGARTKWIYDLYPTAYVINGLFYLKTYPYESIENAKKVIPLSKISKQLFKHFDTVLKKNVTASLYAHGESGFSAHFSKDGSDTLIGAPGVMIWTGTVIRYKNLDAPGEKVSIPHPGKIPQLVDYSYFGYDVSSGNFLSSSRKTYYVGGAPRAGHMTGKVLVFDYADVGDEINVHIELEGFQMGEYFGASVCVVDLNADGLDDLVVGAPQHTLDDAGFSQSEVDEGRVYVFINEDNNILREIGDKHKIIGSQTTLARFGTALANIGDINLDGYNDIAVGAPYEESGRGAIYIYHGRSSGIHHKYSQRITAAEIHTSLSGFGISISRGVDIDGNHYNDLAVGSYSSGHVVVIPSQPVVVFYGRIYSHVTELALNATEFVAFSCLTYTGKQAPPNVAAQITLSVLSTDNRAQFEVTGRDGRTSSTHSYKTSLGDRMEKCTDFRVHLQNENRDYTKPVELHMQYRLDSLAALPTRKRRETIMEPYEFCKNCPVVDPSHSAMIAWKLPYAIECGEDNICRADLTATAEFVGITPPFVLGAQPKLSLRVLVSNRGEQAFLVKLNVSVPRETPLSRLPSICQEVTSSEEAGPTELECDMGSVLAAGAQKGFVLDVDVGILAAKKTTLDFEFNVSSAGEEKSPEDNIFIIPLAVRTEADVGIEGKSNQDQGFHAKENQTFYHTFEVTNNGPSPVNILRLEFKIPVIIKSQKGIIPFIRVYKPTAYFGKQPLTCTTLRGSFASDLTDRVTVNLNGTDEIRSISKRSITDTPSDLPNNRTLFVNCSSPEVECLTVHCDAGPFASRNNRAVVSFKLIADFQKIGPVLGKKDIVVISSVGKVSITNLPNAVQPANGQPDMVTVNSIFFGNLPEQTVDSWLLAVSISGGLLIFLLIVGGLVKMGFFQRGTNNDHLTVMDDGPKKEDKTKKRGKKT